MLPVSTTVNCFVATNSSKDQFKPTFRDKSTQNVFDFARQFYKTTKDKLLENIEAALMNLESNDA
jgi:hypothetical protein